MATNRDQVMTALSNLLGEQTVPTSNVTDRQNFIQNTLDEIYRAYPWQWAQTVATVTLTNGVGALPTNARVDAELDVRQVVAGANSDYVYEEVMYEEQDDFPEGSYKYWVTEDENGANINTKEGAGALTVRYQTVAPEINASISTPFPDPMVIALGALRYVRIGENPEGDVTQEEDLFKIRLDEVIAQAQRSKPRRRQRTKASVTGWYTGRT